MASIPTFVSLGSFIFFIYILDDNENLEQIKFSSTIYTNVEYTVLFVAFFIEQSTPLRRLYGII